MNTKRFSLLIIAFILSLVGISFYGGAITYVFFWTVVLIPVVCILYIIFVVMSLKIYQRTDGRDMVCGSPSEFYITLQNETWFSFSSLRLCFYSSFSTITGLHEGVCLELPPHSSLLQRTGLVCRYRGQYDVGVKKIIVEDFLGLFSYEYRIREPLNVIVSPAMILITELRDSENALASNRDSYTNRTEPDIPVREYAPGDDIRILNWKASASMQQLMVREKKSEEKNGIAIIMEPKRHAGSIEEYLPPENKMTELLLALSLYYMENNIPADVFTAPGQKINVTDPEAFDSLYGLIRTYRFEESLSLKDVLAGIYEKSAFARYKMLIFILQEYTADTSGWIERINTDHVPARIYIIGDKGQYTADTDDRREISIVHVGTESPLEDIL
ncbi:MAG: DUF58 domain-containing protein [Lachnospiraceae bacterium]|nr:DUF58 domain-containing protein [Lachnospiraceae bacterium]MBQ9607473.1 DUF58 domain-containing protein [Lachnospiraceae bacterium]